MQIIFSVYKQVVPPSPKFTVPDACKCLVFVKVNLFHIRGRRADYVLRSLQYQAPIAWKDFFTQSFQFAIDSFWNATGFSWED